MSRSMTFMTFIFVHIRLHFCFLSFTTMFNAFSKNWLFHDPFFDQNPLHIFSFINDRTTILHLNLDFVTSTNEKQDVLQLET